MTVLADLHRALGAVMGEGPRGPLPRHYGDPSGEYGAARSAAVVVDRLDRVGFRMYGRDPVRMLQGLITADIAGSPAGQGVYAAVLTPKGKMIAEVRAFRRDAAGDILLDTEAAAMEPLQAHLRSFVPPLFARVEALSDAVHVMGVYGPAAAQRVSTILDTDVTGAAEEAFAIADVAGAGTVLAARTRYTGEDGYDLFVPAGHAPSIWRAMVDAGVRPAGHGTLEVLRIEAGRPRWGAELDPNVIPLEAGLHERAISDTKGCYTGQEVIIRILHRGHVNWHLRMLLLGDAPAPAAGTQLFRAGEAKPLARVTSACTSPRHGQTIALGYVRREVEPPAELRLGAPDGTPAAVVALP